MRRRMMRSAGACAFRASSRPRTPLNWRMPFGKYNDKGRLIADLPGNCPSSFARAGVPPGERGQLLALMHELDDNGWSELPQPLRQRREPVRRRNASGQEERLGLFPPVGQCFEVALPDAPVAAATATGRRHGRWRTQAELPFLEQGFDLVDERLCGEQVVHGQTERVGRRLRFRHHGFRMMFCRPPSLDDGVGFVASRASASCHLSLLQAGFRTGASG